MERIHSEQAKIVEALRASEQAEERKREEHAAALQRELEGSAKRREQHIADLEQKLKKDVRNAPLLSSPLFSRPSLPDCLLDSCYSICSADSDICCVRRAHVIQPTGHRPRVVCVSCRVVLSRVSAGASHRNSVCSSSALVCSLVLI